MTAHPLHVVFGAGQVGPFVVDALREEGQLVRVVKRHAADLPDDVEQRLGDAMDPGFCRQACAGASVVYHCMNPAYSTAAWKAQLWRLMDNLIAASHAAGARLVVLDNLYMIDASDGRPITEDTPARPRSAKGSLRARVADALFAAHARGDVEVIVGRASDFYGPRGVGTHFGEAFWRPALRGKRVDLLPRLDTPHSYHYIPDVAAALVALGVAPDDCTGRAWLLPCQPAEPTTALVQRFAEALGRPIPVRHVPALVAWGLGLFTPIVRELGEMLYQWDAPFIVDDARFRARFGPIVTDRDTAARATVAWAQATYGA
ncbi:MAG: NAD-dependent epimerase/dehydratase family protein [Gemmatimonadaceae bacterium]|nr:NAD-dependent epimerase/dehydratase family protein [Gemmatimonadaceae bacterium]